MEADRVTVIAPKERQKPLRWRRKDTGRYGPKAFELTRGGVSLVTAQNDRVSGLWFWYGLGMNTAMNKKPLDDVKRAARAFVVTQGK
ncbi:hypothetical protein KQX64_07005 [Rhodopseudomonas palustris]|nr:hypothetical protein KQX64_07005 [Rhodopseudomonas palustris]